MQTNSQKYNAFEYLKSYKHIYQIITNNMVDYNKLLFIY
jgi:hypothetical protein